jgi:hypothetical protein
VGAENWVVISVYCTHSSRSRDKSQLKSISDFIVEECKGKGLVIGGDFNAHTHFFASSNDSGGRLLMEFAENLGLIILNSEQANTEQMADSKQLLFHLEVHEVNTQIPNEALEQQLTKVAFGALMAVPADLERDPPVRGAPTGITAIQESKGYLARYRRKLRRLTITISESKDRNRPEAGMPAISDSVRPVHSRTRNETSVNEVWLRSVD